MYNCPYIYLLMCRPVPKYICWCVHLRSNIFAGVLVCPQKYLLVCTPALKHICWCVGLCSNMFAGVYTCTQIYLLMGRRAQIYLLVCTPALKNRFLAPAQLSVYRSLLWLLTVDYTWSQVVKQISPVQVLAHEKLYFSVIAFHREMVNMIEWG